jgi:hypothetical protein
VSANSPAAGFVGEDRGMERPCRVRGQLEPVLALGRDRASLKAEEVVILRIVAEAQSGVEEAVRVEERGTAAAPAQEAG